VIAAFAEKARLPEKIPLLRAVVRVWTIEGLGGRSFIPAFS
jgi:hypothetical protein